VIKNRYLLCLITAGFLVSEAGCGTGRSVKFVQGDKKIDVMVGGKHVTSYLYGGEPYKIVKGADRRDGGFLTKPVLFPVRSPSGVVVTRGYPLVDVETERKDHPHHVGVFFTYDKINEDGFWATTTAGTSQIKHVKVTEMAPGPDEGKLSIVSHWIGKDGKVLLEEKRDMVFRPGQDEYVIDFFIQLTAQDTKVIFGDTKEGMFAIRVADWLREPEGSKYPCTGKYFSSEGAETAKSIWGKRARWVCLQGEKDGKVIGVAIFNHPLSVNYPPFWHARAYGLFACNPLGQGFFQKSRGVKIAEPFHLTLEPGQTAHFGFRLFVYDGTRSKEQLQERFKDFAK